MRDGVPWRERKKLLEEATAKKNAGMIRKRPAKPWPTVPEGHNPHAPRGIKPWSPGPLWKDKIVILVGGGPTLKEQKHLEALHATKHCKTIAINDAGIDGTCKWADMLFFADCQWWRWNSDKVIQFWPRNKMLVTSTSDTHHVNDIAAKRELFRCWRSRNGWSTNPAEVFGYDGGTQAVNMAAHLGAKRIVLFGIDMQAGPKGETQYHNNHKRPTMTSNYVTKFIPTMKEAVKRCGLQGIEVVRATPGADIGAPLVSIEEALKPIVLDAGCLGDRMPVASLAINE